jgi:hypothetical protein
VGKKAGTRTGTFVTLAVLAVLVSMVALGALVEDYSPTCDGQYMRPGDSCIGSGGGSYADVVDTHYRDFRIVLFIALPLAFFFTIYAIGEWRRGRRRKQLR